MVSGREEGEHYALEAFWHGRAQSEESFLLGFQAKPQAFRPCVLDASGKKKEVLNLRS